MTNDLSQSAAPDDIWAVWLRHKRHGGDSSAQAAMFETLKTFRDKILQNAQLHPDDHLLDVGCGDGLVGFGALPHLPSGQVTFSDISVPLLSKCRDTASELGMLPQCNFVEASANDLQAIVSESVDVATTRSVLIYVEDKQAAFSEFYRVLRPGGRISLFEPINRFPINLPARFHGGLFGYDLSSLPEIARKLGEAYNRDPSVSPPALNSMINFDERDLGAMAAIAGFSEVHLELHIDVEPGKPRSWDAFVNSSPNPLQPTLAEVMANVLTAEERAKAADCLRPQVERGLLCSKSALSYLWAKKC